ncbi:type VI secretion system lipoprotein TssJ [Vibrio sp. Vb2110]|uniref:type VI secretion system lipoprotein TssJ n=1 Tax=unclassified Vibrio TaxID=2614977 RepID=UPI0023ED949E|nr:MULTISPECIES: type VI secretion system lipoprotein TssJ [unclassified Vibrio]ELA9196628.1 type VI secretion system lipoprotein TssJ [Vibrio parahaemolyticus]MDF4743133.1 type VI secretion system lipoprotein TssJ [Vibrio parahaemolyticus]MDG3409878.1 type VI secretion system lipoprotein TssJ [Vibrio parahaemolyticus]MDW1846396.1 type VI secretion system lipoprotein TssJ [Vibrio sp. Vb2130]MDW1880515.1 type VI secretion system lipoprotein TssJ [Vibrio sp. Vb2110]
MMRRLSVLLLSLVLSGCSFWGDEQAVPQLVVNIKAASNINPNVEGKPSPVELRIYQLTDSQAFNQADFIQIYNDEQGLLKAELLLARQLASVLPGESRQEILPMAAGSKYIGVIAGFADYREAKNKVIYKPLIVSSAAINIEIDGINLSVSGEEEK